MSRHGLASTAALVIAALVLAGCGGGSPKAAGTPTDSASASPTSYPIPTGCPTGDQITQGIGGSTTYSAVSLDGLNALLAHPLPTGGCAYVNSYVGTATGGTATSQAVKVWYFNVGASGNQTVAQMDAWATAAGGTPATNKCGTGNNPPCMSGAPTVDTTGNNFDLPDSFSGWTNAGMSTCDGTTQMCGPQVASSNPIPAWTQGTLVEVAFQIDSAKTQALVSAVVGTTGTSTASPTTGGYSSQALRYTDSSGWIYKFTPLFTSPQVTIQKDTQNSPPGQAEFEIDFDQTTLSASIDGATPGRTPPTVDGFRINVLYPFKPGSDQATQDAWNQVPAYANFSACGQSNWGTDNGAIDGLKLPSFKQLGLPYGTGIQCLFWSSVASTSSSSNTNFVYKSPDLPEGFVDTVVAALKAEQPVIVVQPPGNNYCAAFYLPNGKVTYQADPNTPAQCKLSAF